MDDQMKDYDTKKDDLLKVAIQEMRENVKKKSPQEINFLNAIKPYLGQTARKQIDKVTSILYDVRVYENIVSEGGILKSTVFHEDDDSVYEACEASNDNITDNIKLNPLGLALLLLSSTKEKR